MTIVPSALNVLAATEKWAIGEYERCLLMIWSAQPDADAMYRRAEYLRDLCRKFPGRCALVEVVEPTSRPPDDDTRKIAMSVFRELGADLSAMCFALEGGEMKAVLARAVITGMLFFLGQPQPSKVFKQVSDMAEWVRARIAPDDPDFNANLAVAFEQLRKTMRAVQNRHSS